MSRAIKPLQHGREAPITGRCVCPSEREGNFLPVDIPTALPLFPCVILFRRIIALVVLALWLPATLHCACEAAGFESMFRCVDDSHDASVDACDLVENGVIKPAINTATLTAPLLVAAVFCQLSPAPEISFSAAPVGLSEVVAAPREINRTWHFVTRAAPAPRAPGYLV